MTPSLRLAALLFFIAFNAPAAPPAPALPYPPVLPNGAESSTDMAPEFLKAPPTLRAGVLIAKTAPTVDFRYYPGQDYPGNPWSAWGDSIAANGKYYASIGDHRAPGGNGFVYEYDPATKAMRKLAEIRATLALPEGDYTPGKIHSRLDLGSDGWLYFSTHRGSTRVTTDAYHYLGDWILRCDPATGKTEVVAQGPVPKHCIPCSVLDPKRLIFYGGTAPGNAADGEGIQFFAYDVKAKKVLYAGPNGPARYMMLSSSTGRLYFTPGQDRVGQLMRYDPEKGGAPEKIEGMIGLRSATQETPDGFIYTVSTGQGGAEATLYRFNVKTEKVEELGTAAVGSQAYITTIDADPTGRYLYYIPGAHGGSESDGAAVVQFDTKTHAKKVIAFLGEYYQQKFGCTLRGTFSSAVDPAGDKLYITWNNSRGSKVWDSAVLTVVHIPAAERAVE